MSTKPNPHAQSLKLVLTILLLFEPDDKKEVCIPKDFVDLIVDVDDEYFLEPYVENSTPCLPNCFYTEYITEVTEATIDPGAIRRYVQAVGVNELGDPE